MNAHDEEGSRDSPYAANSAVGANLLCLLKLCSKRRRVREHTNAVLAMTMTDILRGTTDYENRSDIDS